MEQGLVSVIIPNYNYAHYVREAVDSVLAQTYESIEVIVVDDGSKDNSRQVLAGYGDRITAIFQQNQGVSAARNNGVAHSRGEFVAFLDADDAWQPAKVEKQVSRFRSDQLLGLVHVAVEEVDADGRTLLERTEGLEGEVADDLLKLERNDILGGGSGLMVTRNAFERVGGFDLRMSTSADWDFFYQVASRYPVAFIPELLLKYRVHNSNMHSNVKLMEHDMEISFGKIFQDRAISKSRRAYGVLYKTLAGSYFRARQYRDFFRTAYQSLSLDPSNLGYFLRFPLRRIGMR
jgi:glycosyltransferase involved in cell wall biosynthesis